MPLIFFQETRSWNCDRSAEAGNGIVPLKTAPRLSKATTFSSSTSASATASSSATTCKPSPEVRLATPWWPTARPSASNLSLATSRLVGSTRAGEALFRSIFAFTAMVVAQVVAHLTGLRGSGFDSRWELGFLLFSILLEVCPLSGSLWRCYTVDFLK